MSAACTLAIPTVTVARQYFPRASDSSDSEKTQLKRAGSGPSASANPTASQGEGVWAKTQGKLGDIKSWVSHKVNLSEGEADPDLVNQDQRGKRFDVITSEALVWQLHALQTSM